ncbi:MAG: hypothetical protein HY866_05955 [Chloroflexi bacterium]|nr:hypothetical protein [Chloroflexota bacterium]
MTALILAGHGSHLSPHTAGLVWRYVDRLRVLGVADEITACFWKEPPSFHGVLNTVQAQDVIVVPLFTAQGYFTQTVIPAEMGLSGAVTIRDGRTIWYAPTLGEHPLISAIVRQRVIETLESAALDPQSVAVAVIGHGTDRSSRSREAAQQQAETLRAAGLVAEVAAVFLDDDPPIQSLYDTTRAANIIAVPFFLAPGSHVMQDVPRALGLPRGASYATIRGRGVWYSAPVGTDETICSLILALARSNGAVLDPIPVSDVWRGFPAVGQRDLWEAVESAGGLAFGQLWLTPSEVSPLNRQPGDEIITTPAALRQRVREQVSIHPSYPIPFSHEGRGGVFPPPDEGEGTKGWGVGEQIPFRPLPTRADLPEGWRVLVTASHVLGAVVETVYPGALADWSQQRRGTFVAGSLRALGARQTGLFRNIERLPVAVVAHTVDKVCRNCIRFPAWFGPGSGAIPCAEPCNVWLSAAREAKR